MDFISNLIKRPISLVLNETSTTMDKYPISASLPNPTSEVANSKDLIKAANEDQKQTYYDINDKYPSSMPSTCNDDNMTDFIGVPEEFLDEFKEILPPPPLPLENSNLLDIDILRSFSITPPPPPSLSPSAQTSQTIDELLSQISDNLQQAGLNDDVLDIASPSINSELTPLSSKSTANNSKILASSSDSGSHLNTSKNYTTAAGSANSSVCENNSSNKIHIESELQQIGIVYNDHEQQQENKQSATKDQLNNSGVNKSSNKFLGLTEFDEAQIPELPSDLTPNIEEYNVTFEKCFVPTSDTPQCAIASNEFKNNKATHLILPSETDVTSSDNETFSDCYDEKDPLASTFAEPASTDVTAELESYQSAINKSLSSSLNNTMENLANETMQAEDHLLKKINQNLTIEQPQAEQMDEDEPMDVDMNETIEIIHNTSNNIHQVEKVLQHAENILQDLEDKNDVKGVNNKNVSELLEKQTESPKEDETLKTIEIIHNTSNNMHHVEKVLQHAENILQDLEDKNYVKGVNNKNVNELLEKQTESSKEDKPLESTANINHHGEIEHSRHEFNLNKSMELPLNKAHTLSTECVIENISNDMALDENETQEQLKSDSDNNLNLTNDITNSSTISNSSSKSTVDSKTGTNINLTLSLNASMNSQKSSVPNSPSFPIRTAESIGFSRSPEAMVEKLAKSPFLEKSDYMASLETQAIDQRSFNNLNGTYVEPSSNSITNNVDDKCSQPDPAVQKDNKRRTFAVDTSKADEEQEENKHQSFLADTLKTKVADGKRRTFSIKTNEIIAEPLTQFPSMDTKYNPRRTFVLTEGENIPKETIVPIPTEEFNSKSAEASGLNTSVELMDVDDYVSSTSNITPLLTNKEQRPQSPPLQVNKQNSPSPPLAVTQPRSQSPSSPIVQQKLQSSPDTTAEQTSEHRMIMETPPLSSLPMTQEKSLSPPPTIQPKSESPPLPIPPERSQSPPLPTMQPKSQSPPLPTLQSRSHLPPTMLPKPQSVTEVTQYKSEILPTSLESTDPHAVIIKEEKISPTPFGSINTSIAVQPLSKLIQKRPSIRDARARAADILSAKEQSNIKAKDEKDVFVEKFIPSPIEEAFTAVSATSTTISNSSEFPELSQTLSSCSSTFGNMEQQNKQQIDDEFTGSNNLILNASDFDYLLTKGNNNAPVDRSSLLLKFDPLLGVPVPVNQGLQQLQIPSSTINPCLSPPLEEDEHNDSNRSFVIDTKPGASAKLLKDTSQEVKQQLQLEQQVQQNKQQLTQGANKKNATMSVDVIKDMSLDNDCNKTFENSNSTQSDDKQINYKMDELEKKIKNEVLKTEDIEKKLKDAEQREEALIKRITEKDKTITKMTGVIEAYEKAIAELIADKEQLTQHYEKQLAEVKADRDSNYHHLTSLETTFSDLHVKYEKSKEMTCQLKESEEALQAEKRKNLENLHLQEQRYDRMKNHAMQQLEIANKKLESLTREHSIEITKLKALLKKEEIARSSVNEQLAHKTKENAELVKICDELISGQGSNFSFEPFDPKKH